MKAAISKPSIQIYMLGRFEIARQDRILKVESWSRHKAAALLQLLALEHRLVGDHVIDILWPDTTFDAAANNRYQTLHSLRHTLDTFLGDGSADAILSFKGGTQSR